MKAVELFCGAGGFSLGMKRAGIAVLRAYDEWDAALAVYERNMPPSRFERSQRLPNRSRAVDVGDLLVLAPAIAKMAPDLIFGGPPCQDFSSAGNQIEGTNADMTLAFAMTICVARPQWFVMENVPPAAKSQAWQRARSLLTKAGYGMTQTVMNASLYGVPQARKRLIVVGRLGEIDDFLLSAIEAARSKRPTSVRDALGDEVGVLAPIQPEAGPEVRLIYSPAHMSGRGVRSIDEPFPTILNSSRGRPGKRERASPHPGNLAPAHQVPSITVEQMSLLQGFPAGWDWTWEHGKKTARKNRYNVKNRDKMIANAVPPPLAEAIGTIVLARADGAIPEIEPAFSRWLTKNGIASGQTLRNKRAALNKARRLLRGRMLADESAELGSLEAAEGFQALSVTMKSELRTALRLHRRWRTELQHAAERKEFYGFTAAEYWAHFDRPSEEDGLEEGRAVPSELPADLMVRSSIDVASDRAGSVEPTRP